MPPSIILRSSSEGFVRRQCTLKAANPSPRPSSRAGANLGWQQLKNGDLLDVAERAGFDVLVTGDKNLSYQQSLTGRKLALVVLPTIDWRILKLNPAKVAVAVNSAKPGSFQAVAP